MTKTTYWKWIKRGSWALGIFLCVMFVSRQIIARKNSYGQSRNATQSQPEVRPCLIETTWMAPPDFIEPPMRGKWREIGGIIEVVQEENTYHTKLVSAKGPTVWMSSNVFQFSFNPMTGEGRWSSSAAKLSGRIVASHEPESWKIVRLQGEEDEVREIFSFKPL